MSKINESTVARIAGNILSGYTGGSADEEGAMVQFAVALARMVVAEVERTEPDLLAAAAQEKTP